MSGIVEINSQEIERIVYKGEPVITFKMMDSLHQRVDGRSRKTFYENKHRLIENEDYFKVPYKEWSKISGVRNSDTSQNHTVLTFLTQTGYLILVKSFQDELAWKIQRQLVKSYFVAKQIIEEKRPETNASIDVKLNRLNQLTHLVPIISKEELKRLKIEIMGDVAIRQCAHTTRIAVIMGEMNAGQSYRIVELAKKTGMNYNRCKSSIHKAYKRGALKRVCRGVYQVS
jgi:hypothetical protein